MTVASEAATKAPTLEPAGAVAQARARNWSDVFFLPALLLVWFAGCAVAFTLKRSQLLISIDGGTMRGLAHTQFEWGVPYLHSSLDFFQGLGDIFFQVNFTMFPSFVIAWLLNSESAAPIVIYLVIAIEITSAILFFGRCVGVSTLTAVAAAVLTVVIFFPMSAPTLIYPVMAVSPVVGTGIAVGLVMGGAFLRIGRAKWPSDLAWSLLILALMAWTALSGITVLILSAPSLLLYAASGVLAATTRGERWRKIGFAIVIATLLAITGPALYLVSLVIDTAAATFPLELANDRASFKFASLLFHWRSFGPTGPLLVGLAILGAIVAIFDRSNRTLRFFGITLLTYLGSRLTFATLTIIFDFWRGPSPIYFEFFVIPLYAIFAMYFLGRIFELAQWIGGWRAVSTRSAQALVVAGGVSAGVALAATTHSQNYGFEYPPRSTPFTTLMAQEAALTPGGPFRGRAVNMTGRSKSDPTDWFQLVTRDEALTEDIGNDLRMTGLRAFRIPVLFEYTPTITPAFYAITTRLLAEPGDKQMRSVQVTRRLNVPVLEMLGVRYVITDAPSDSGAALRATQPVKGATLYLYETPKANLGNYSPTIVRKASTAVEIMNRLADPAFDASREIVADVPGGGEALTPATNARLTFDGVALHVAAESTGRSILLLPLEFSRCLGVESAQGPAPLLFRANLLQTGVLFSGKLDASISLRTGPFFLNPGCRLSDFFDMRALQIGELPPVIAAAGAK
ncbi:MAG: hypothetical protein U1E81_13440 [Xanthobacteraceae bacterium]